MKASIIHIIVGLNTGGAESALKRLVINRSKHINTTVVVSLTDDGKLGPLLRDMGVTVIALNIRGTLSFFTGLFRLTKIIRALKPDIVHTWMYHANLIGGLASRLANNKNVVWSIRRTKLEYLDSKVTYIVMKMGALLSRIIPRVIVCVAEAAIDHHTAYGYEKTKMIVIPNGFDLSVNKYNESERERIRRALNISSSDIVIGTVGRFHHSKDFHNFIQSASRAMIKFQQVHCIMLGRNVDSKNEELVNWLNKYDVTSRFSLLGEVNTVPAYMSAMDIFCLSSRTEGFPNVLAEAMCVGLPCVATDVGDVTMVVESSAIIVKPCNSIALTNGLLSMLCKTEKSRKKMGQEGKKIISKNFEVDQVCSRYFKLYDGIIKLKR